MIGPSGARSHDQTPVLVVGGGPAGSVTALLLARSGWQVELVDRARFPRGKACGECVNPAGVLALERLGLREVVEAASPVPLRGWEIALPGRRPVQGAFAPADAALGIARADLDGALLEAARRAGVRVREGVRLLDAAPGDARSPALARFRLPDGKEEVRRTRLLVGADGLHSRVAAATGLAGEVRAPRKISLSWRLRAAGGRGEGGRDRGRLVLGAGVTAGIAPVRGADASWWNATLVVAPPDGPPPRSLREEGWNAFLELLHSVPGPGPIPRGGDLEITEGPWTSGSFHRRVKRPAGGRTLLVGDAAGYFDPLTGQGIFRALRSAELAASAVGDHLCAQDGGDLREADALAPERYARALRRALAPGRGLQRLIESVVARGVARRAALGILGRVPPAASVLVRCTGDRACTVLDAPARPLPGPGSPPRRSSEP